MADFGKIFRRRPTVVQIISVSLVLAGFLMASINWWFLVVAAAGTLGPGLLRELGWLNDKDEFQLAASRRAGYHAFLVGGISSFLLIAFFRSGERQLENLQELPTLLLAIMWFTWIFSLLVDYWGPQKTASRVLYGFGAAWTLFIVLSNTGAEWTGPVSLFSHLLLAVPFFVLGWTSQRWPRVTGILLLGASIFLFSFFGFFRSNPLDWITQTVTAILFVGPLAACGLILLFCQHPTASETDSQDATRSSDPAAVQSDIRRTALTD